MAKYGLNKVMLIGNLGADPEVRSIDSGVKVATLNLATTESYTDKSGNRVDRTEWHRVVLWRGLADTAERYLKKGSTIYIEGRLTTRSWDGEDGKKNYTTEVVADRMTMLDGPRTSLENPQAQNIQQSHNPGMQGNPQGAQMDTAADDLPF